MTASPLRITHVQGIFSPEHGGGCFSLANCCRGQIDAGHQVSVRVLEGYPNTSGALQLAPPIDQQVRRVDWPSRLGASVGLRRLLRTDPTPDIYHLHGVWLRAMHYGAVEARRRRRPYVVELMGAYEKYPLQQKWLRKWISRHWFQDALLQRAGCLHVNSLQEADALRELGFRVPIAAIPVGVNTEEIRVRSENADARPLYPQLAQRPFVLYLSRIHSKKGIELLLKTWATLKQRFPEYVLAIVGNGDTDYVDGCKRLMDDLHLGDCCHWLGQVGESEKSWLYRHAEVYVLPSYSENFGNTVPEALAHETPVITTIYTPWVHLPQEGCGWIADTSVDSLQDAMKLALELSPAERRRMGNVGRQLVERQYSITSVVRQIDRVYGWLLGGARPDEILV